MKGCCKFTLGFVASAFVACAAIWGHIHREVIFAKINGEPTPPRPENHPCTPIVNR